MRFVQLLLWRDQVFAILGQAGNDHLRSAIEAKFGGRFLQLKPDQWLLVSDGSSEDVSNELGITSGVAGTAVVINVGTSFGRAEPEVWAWMDPKMALLNRRRKALVAFASGLLFGAGAIFMATFGSRALHPWR